MSSRDMPVTSSDAVHPPGAPGRLLRVSADVAGALQRALVAAQPHDAAAAAAAAPGVQRPRGRLGQGGGGGDDDGEERWASAAARRQFVVDLKRAEAEAAGERANAKQRSATLCGASRSGEARVLVCGGGGGGGSVSADVCACVSVCLYVYVWVERERERWNACETLRRRAVRGR